LAPLRRFADYDGDEDADDNIVKDADDDSDKDADDDSNKHADDDRSMTNAAQPGACKTVQSTTARTGDDVMTCVSRRIDLTERGATVLG
jgi:hypothetical protein